MTDDGSNSIATDKGLSYHSTLGALQESRHIFINAGLVPVLSRGAGPVAVYEMGFGTGLNALLTLIEAAGRPVYYEAVETVPLGMEIVEGLNYCERLEAGGREAGRLEAARLGMPGLGAPGVGAWGPGSGLQPVFERLHSAPWGEEAGIVPGFTLMKVLADGAGYRPQREADVVYYDAFDPTVQPELWRGDILRRVYGAMRPGGVLVTYCCKGVVRRTMEAVGFVIEKLPGPPGKREILRARKPG